MQYRKLVLFTCISFAAAACLSGCGGLEEFPIVKVSGTVLCEGKPVPNAVIFFEPVASGGSAESGKQGFALSDSEGRFVVSTYGEGDGAVLGKHLVRVGKSETSPPCECALNAEKVLKEVELSGAEPVELELVLAKKSARNRDQVLEQDD